MSRVTDCDYCGEIRLCFEDTMGGTCCTDCGDEETREVYPDEDRDYDDGQPDEYTEWQDVYGGDDWDHGQFDMHEDF